MLLVFQEEKDNRLIIVWSWLWNFCRLVWIWESIFTTFLRSYVVRNAFFYHLVGALFVAIDVYLILHLRNFCLRVCLFAPK